MSDTLAPSLFRRLRHTPLRDLLRGRLSSCLDLAAHIDAADLPTPAKHLVRRVVKRTRLWRIEQAAVADELIAHFADGLDAGATLDDLLAAFGNENQAARLIRRAKKRQRPLLWHAWRCAFWCGVALVTFYLGVAVVFYTGSPTIAVNYVDRMNEPALALPEDQRAWPLYRAALLSLDQFPKEAWLLASPDEPSWQTLADYVGSHQEAIQLVRDGAVKPGLGLPVGLTIDEEDRAVFADSDYAPSDRPFTTQGPLFQVALPHLAKLRNLAKLVRGDTLLAGEERNAGRAMQGLAAFEGLARHAGGDDVLISQYVALSIRNLALDSLERLITRHPDLFSDTELRDLAHRLAQQGETADMISIDGERRFVYDLVQRTFTDDGQGDGRLTPEGPQIYQQLISSTNSASSHDLGLAADAAIYVASPAAMLVSASRRDLVDWYDVMMDRMQANLAVPIWQVDPSWADRELVAFRTSPIQQARYWLIAQLIPAMGSLRIHPERYLGHRDGALIAIALELHRRRHGGYPETLDALVPGLLPKVPRDRITGDPARFRLINDKPVVYSVGVDRDDDGGMMWYASNGDPIPDGTARWDNDRAYDGDWVLWPQSLPLEPPPSDSDDFYGF